MKMKRNEKRDSGESSDLENKLNFFTGDGEELVETGGRTSSTVASTSTSSEGTTRSESSGIHSVVSNKVESGLVVRVLYKERVKSFEVKRWPYISNQHCTPEKLSLAGFEYLPRLQPAVKCVFCGVILEDLRLIGSTDPWQLHATKKPSCGYIQLGKRNNSGEYSYKEMVNLYLHAKVRLMADSYVAAEVECKSNMEDFLTEAGREVISR